MKKNQQMRGKTVFVAGGSSGLGKEIAKLSAAQGAHVTIFARRLAPLGEAHSEILEQRQDENQVVRAICLDLAVASEVNDVFKSQPHLPDVLYLVAGGTAEEIGFLTDIPSSALESCMTKNYFTAAHPAQSILNLWTANDRVSKAAACTPRLRQLVFVSSVAALCTIPGYAAYSPAKCAVRSLADVLRLEAVRLSTPGTKYTVHIAFPSNFLTPAFLTEQVAKPALTKRLDGSTGDIAAWQRKFPNAEIVSAGIVRGVQKGEFAICDGSFEGEVCWANAVGPSPRRGWGVWDLVVGAVVGWVAWPVKRRIWERQCREDSKAR